MNKTTKTNITLALLLSVALMGCGGGGGASATGSTSTGAGSSSGGGASAGITSGDGDGQSQDQGGVPDQGVQQIVQQYMAKLKGPYPVHYTLKDPNSAGVSEIFTHDNSGLVSSAHLKDNLQDALITEYNEVKELNPQLKKINAPTVMVQPTPQRATLWDFSFADSNSKTTMGFNSSGVATAICLSNVDFQQSKDSKVQALTAVLKNSDLSRKSGTSEFYTNSLYMDATSSIGEGVTVNSIPAIAQYGADYSNLNTKLGVTDEFFGLEQEDGTFAKVKEGVFDIKGDVDGELVLNRGTTANITCENFNSLTVNEGGALASTATTYNPKGKYFEPVTNYTTLNLDGGKVISGSYADIDTLNLNANSYWHINDWGTAGSNTWLAPTNFTVTNSSKIYVSVDTINSGATGEHTFEMNKVKDVAADLVALYDGTTVKAAQKSSAQSLPYNVLEDGSISSKSLYLSVSDVEYSYMWTLSLSDPNGQSGDGSQDNTGDSQDNTEDNSTAVNSEVAVLFTNGQHHVMRHTPLARLVPALEQLTPTHAITSAPVRFNPLHHLRNAKRAGAFSFSQQQVESEEVTTAAAEIAKNTLFSVVYTPKAKLATLTKVGVWGNWKAFGSFGLQATSAANHIEEGVLEGYSLYFDEYAAVAQMGVGYHGHAHSFGVSMWGSFSRQISEATLTYGDEQHKIAFDTLPAVYWAQANYNAKLAEGLSLNAQARATLSRNQFSGALSGSLKLSF